MYFMKKDKGQNTQQRETSLIVFRGRSDVISTLPRLEESQEVALHGDIRFDIDCREQNHLSRARQGSSLIRRRLGGNTVVVVVIFVVLNDDDGDDDNYDYGGSCNGNEGDI